jgi:radical SAM superfamily enzyme YgiQ (UPF0313 family)
MKVLLIKCHKETLFSRVSPIVTEPLELEYLAAVLEERQIPWRIFDKLLEGGTLDNVLADYHPDILVLTGYITAVKVILQYAAYAKSVLPQCQVIIGGVHAELCWEDFFEDVVDYIVHSNGAHVFSVMVDNRFDPVVLRDQPGLALRTGRGWKDNEKELTDLRNRLRPDRRYFHQHMDRTRYLNEHPVALVQTAISCPFKCRFCYCRLLNQGFYITRSLTDVIEEIQYIQCETIWIVDDTFLVSRDRVLEFIRLIRAKELKRKFIIYSRVDFIEENADLMPTLRKAGIIELIVGIETPDDAVLQDYQKGSTAYQNIRAIEILRQAGIRVTALLMVNLDATQKDFNTMNRWISRMKLDRYTISILTPLKGTSLYDEYRERIWTQDPSRYDFLHLTAKPQHMSSWRFYLNFYSIYGRMFFRSAPIRWFLRERLKGVRN